MSELEPLRSRLIRARAERRVIHVVSSNALAGIERHVLGLIAHQRELGRDARLCCRRDADLLRDEAERRSVPVEDWRALVHPGPAVVHVHDGRAALAAGACRLPRSSVLVRSQHFITPASATRASRVGGLSLVGHRVLNRRYEGQISVSQAVLRAAVNRGDAGSGQCVVIPAGIELPSATVLQAAAEERRTAAAPVLIAAGRMELEREVDLVLRAMVSVLQRVPEVQLILVGDGSEASRLRELARELNLAAAVQWPGWVSDLNAVLRRGRVYLNPWRNEAFGMGTAEAMALGLVPVVPDAGAALELIEPGISGISYTAGDHQALADGICSLLADRARSDRIGAAAMGRAQRYGMADVAAATLEFYTSLGG